MIIFLVSRLAAISSIMVALSIQVFACQCPTTWPVPSCVAYWRAERVFIATVGKIDKARYSSDYSFAITFNVEQTFKGESTKNIDVYFIGGDCALPVKVGERYLVYADHNSQTNSLELQPCGNTIPLASAKHDLDYIHSLGKASQESISGFLLGLAEEDMKDVKIAIEGPGGVQWSHLNKIGYYNFENVGSGSFSIRIYLPFQVIAPAGQDLKIMPDVQGMNASYSINLEENRCDHREIYLKRASEIGTAIIKGIVLDNFAKPLAGVFPRIYPVSSDGRISINEYESAKTDEKGSFTFSKVRPGQYVLAIKDYNEAKASSSNSLVYFPNTYSLQDAERINVTGNAILELRPFILAMLQRCKSQKRSC